MRKRWLFLFFLLLAGGATTAHAQTVDVTPGQSLQTVLEQAHPGDTIRLQPGIHQGPVVIAKPLRLTGEPGAVLSGQGQGNVISIKANNVSITHLMIRDSGTSDAGVYISANNAVVEQNRIEGVFHGVALYQANGCVISQNDVSSLADSPIKGYGVYINEGSNNQVLQNRLHQVQDGVYCSFSRYNVIHANEVSNARYGVHVMDSDQVTILDNRSENNRVGAMIMQSRQITLGGNLFNHHKGPTGAGMLLFDSRSLEVSGNRLVDNRTGLYVENTYDSVFSENTIAGNNTGIEIKQVSKNNRFYRNNIIANVRQIRNLGLNSNLFDDGKEGNYWDDYRGIDADHDGSGEQPYISGDPFYALMDKKPELQLFFKSPAIVIWNATKKFVAADGQSVADCHPLLRPLPLPLGQGQEETRHGTPLGFGVVVSLMLAASLWIFTKGRKRSW